MPPQTPASCTHELRPGITVCLHCRHAEREASAARLRARLLRGGVAAAAVAILGAGAAALLRDGGSPPVATVAAATPPAAPAPAAEPVRGPAATSATADAPAPAVAVAAAIVPPPVAVRRAGPIIPEGRTELRGGVVAVRTGDTVAVHFDTPATRTRRRDKFERMVRATLPAVFGTTADSALAGVPAGRLAASGNLLTELPTRGLRLATPNGTLALWPATRPGRDGPLVVTYVATLER